MLSENEVKAAWTSFQDSLSYVTYLFSEWRIWKWMTIGNQAFYQL